MSANNKKLKSKKRKNSLTPNSGEQTKRQIPNMAATTPPIVYAGVEVNNRHSESPLQTDRQTDRQTDIFIRPNRKNTMIDV